MHGLQVKLDTLARARYNLVRDRPPRAGASSSLLFVPAVFLNRRVFFAPYDGWIAVCKASDQPLLVGVTCFILCFLCDRWYMLIRISLHLGDG